METDINKIRSVRSCIRGAYDLFGTNLRTIVRKTWLPALVFSLVTALTVLISPSLADEPVTSRAEALHFLGSVALFIGLLVLAIAAFAWIDTAVVSLLNGRSFKFNLPRVARQAVFTIVVVLVLSLITMAASFIPFHLAAGTKQGITPQVLQASGAVTLGLSLLYAIVLIPTAYSTMKYFIEPQQRVMSIIGKPYLRGWRHWGYLFTITLLLAIIGGVLYIIVQMPTLITTVARQQDEAGLLMGDPTGLPAYFPVLAFIAAMLCSFVWSYVLVWAEMAYYYAYGSIEARIKEKSLAK